MTIGTAVAVTAKQWRRVKNAGWVESLILDNGSQGGNSVVKKLKR